jgi:hypothetical protein
MVVNVKICELRDLQAMLQATLLSAISAKQRQGQVAVITDAKSCKRRGLQSIANVNVSSVKCIGWQWLKTAFCRRGKWRRYGY